MPQILEAGLTTVSIVPDQPCPMAGFYARTGFNRGVHDPLELTALYLRQGDAEVWICAGDLCQFPDHEAKAAGQRILQGRLSCRAASLFLNASHTHGSPTVNPHPAVLPPPLHSWFEPRYVEAARAYSEFLWERVAEACEGARREAEPAMLMTANGRSRLPMSRRRTLNGFIDNAPAPEGETDSRLRLLAVCTPAGDVRAMGLVLACHPTSTGAQLDLTADFPGAWRRAMRQRHGSSIDFFFMQGCGGDARPSHTRDGDRWRTVDFDELERMGRDLADEADAAIQDGWKPVPTPALATARRTVHLPCSPLTPEQGWVRQCAAGLDVYRQAYLDAVAADRLRGLNPPLQIAVDLSLVRLSPDLALIGADCEILCGLGRRMESALPGVDAMVCGLTNGGFGYLPDDAENERGGYEAESYIFEKWGGPFARGIDDTMRDSVASLWAGLPQAAATAFHHQS